MRYTCQCTLQVSQSCPRTNAPVLAPEDKDYSNSSYMHVARWIIFVSAGSSREAQ